MVTFTFFDFLFVFEALGGGLKDGAGGGGRTISEMAPTPIPSHPGKNKPRGQTPRSGQNSYRGETAPLLDELCILGHFGAK